MNWGQIQAIGAMVIMMILLVGGVKLSNVTKPEQHSSWTMSHVDDNGVINMIEE